MQNELPKLVNIAKACEWLQAKSGKQWELWHLLDAGLSPYFWLDYTEPEAALFGNRYEGMLCRMLYGGDIQRLHALSHAEVLVTMYETPDGDLARNVPGISVPQQELVFQASDLLELCAAYRSSNVVMAQTEAPVVTESAPVAKETPAERRARRLAMFESEKKREPRGALQRLANREGVDRSNLGKEIKKAKAEQREQTQSGLWPLHRVVDGKRIPGNNPD